MTMSCYFSIYCHLNLFKKSICSLIRNANAILSTPSVSRQHRQIFVNSVRCMFLLFWGKRKIYFFSFCCSSSKGSLYPHHLVSYLLREFLSIMEKLKIKFEYAYFMKSVYSKQCEIKF